MAIPKPTDTRPRAAEQASEWSRLLKLLLRANARSIGLFPTSDDVPTAWLGTRLGPELAGHLDETVIVVDAVVLPATEKSARSDHEPEQDVVLGRWISDHCAVVRAQGPGIKTEVDAVRRILQHAKRRSVRTIVDLGAISSLPLRLRASGLVEGACLVAVAGRTTEEQLSRAANELGDKNLGVVLLER
jgi:hypothetical protein